MYTEDFEKVNKKKYRIISCFDDELKVADGSLMMFSKDFKTIIFPQDGKHCCLISWKNGVFVRETVGGIPVVSIDTDTKEKTVVFEDEYLDQMCDAFNIKNASSHPIKPYNKNNISYYLRVMRNVSNDYKEKLKNFNQSKKKYNPVLEKDSIIGATVNNSRVVAVNPNGSIEVIFKNGKKKTLTIENSKSLIKKYNEEV